MGRLILGTGGLSLGTRGLSLSWWFLILRVDWLSLGGDLEIMSYEL